MAVTKKKIKEDKTIMQVYIDKAIVEELKQLAKAKGLTFSGYVRMILISHINRVKRQRQAKSNNAIV